MSTRVWRAMCLARGELQLSSRLSVMSLLEAWISVVTRAAALRASGACKENGKFLPIVQIAPPPPSVVTLHGRGEKSPFSSHLCPLCLLSLNEAVLAGQSLSR